MTDYVVTCLSRKLDLTCRNIAMHSCASHDSDCTLYCYFYLFAVLVQFSDMSEICTLCANCNIIFLVMIWIVLCNCYFYLVCRAVALCNFPTCRKFARSAPIAILVCCSHDLDCTL